MKIVKVKRAVYQEECTRGNTVLYYLMLILKKPLMKKGQYRYIASRLSCKRPFLDTLTVSGKRVDNLASNSQTSSADCWPEWEDA